MNVNLMIGALSTAAIDVPPLGERVVEGLQTLVLGLGMVFAVLALLWGVLAIFKVIFYDLPEKKKKAQSGETKKADEAEKTKAQPASEVVPTQAYTAVQDDGAVIAAITAALTEYFAESGTYTGGFRVVSFRKSQTGSAWNKK